MAQTDPATYSFTMPQAQPGQVYDIRPDVVVSFAAETALTFGQPLMRGANPEKQVIVSDATSFLGVALFDPTQEVDRDTGVASYAIGDAVSVLTDGAVWVVAGADTIIAGETAYVTAAGLYTNVSTAALAIGTFQTGGDTNDLVVIELT